MIVMTGMMHKAKIRFRLPQSSFPEYACANKNQPTGIIDSPMYWHCAQKVFAANEVEMISIPYVNDHSTNERDRIKNAVTPGTWLFLETKYTRPQATIEAKK